jgi:hypothetical protein
MKPQIPIEVDEATGVWTTDGLPMVYVPRHFFVNNHMAIEAALGREQYAKLLYDAGYKSAYFWCASEAKTHGLAGLPVFEHYLKRLSQRGWGQFGFQTVDARSGAAEIRLENSLFVLAEAASATQAAGITQAASKPASAGVAQPPASRGMPAAGAPPLAAGAPPLAAGAASPGARPSSPAATQCYMFSGWFAGAMDWVLETSGAHVKTQSGEVQCGGQGHSHCLFRVRPQN